MARNTEPKGDVVVPLELVEQCLMAAHYLKTLERMEIVEGKGNLKVRMEHYDDLSRTIGQLNRIIDDAKGK
jgi:hypothetical protein